MLVVGPHTMARSGSGRAPVAEGIKANLKGTYDHCTRSPDIRVGWLGYTTRTSCRLYVLTAANPMHCGLRPETTKSGVTVEDKTTLFPTLSCVPYSVNLLRN